nr:hypothetical protein [Aneurinibacillus tyrosinisolvens]
MVPFKMVADNLNVQVTWDGGLRQVRIYTAPTTMDVTGFYGLGDPKKGTSSWTDLFQQDYPNPATGNTDMVSKLAFCWYSMDRSGNFTASNKYGWQKPDGKDTITQL